LPLKSDPSHAQKPIWLMPIIIAQLELIYSCNKFKKLTANVRLFKTFELDFTRGGAI
jgi:hypothetical protein